MATRHQAREAVISLLYAYESGNQDIKKFAAEILEEKKIRNKQSEFAMGLFEGAMHNIQSLDDAITKNLQEWDFDRLGEMEKAILRLGAYEILFCEVDGAVVINEAVELSKKFGTDKSPKFINGVLDAIKREKEKGCD